MEKCLNIGVIILLIGLFFGCNSETNETNSENTNTTETTTITGTEETVDKKTILFLGNSLTAGYQLDPNDAFPALIEAKCDSVGLNYKTVNGGISGETTAGGKDRIDWMLRKEIDVLVLELGGNDGLRGIDPKSSYENLQFIIDQTKAKYPECKILLAGMEAPPNMGKKFTDEFRGIYQKLAKENELALIPFLL